MGIFDVSPSFLIKELANDLKTKIEKPQWIDFVKSGSSRQRVPQDKDFWFYRNASVLYRVYKDGPVGTESLRSYYGSRKNNGVKPEHRKKSSGKIIRACLQLLEKKGFIKKSKKGRMITSSGEKYLYEISKIAQKNTSGILQQIKKIVKPEHFDAKAKEVQDALRKAIVKKDNPEHK